MSLAQPPRVISCLQTIAYANGGFCLSRFGDGELRIASGKGDAVSQRTVVPKLVAEMRDILSRRPPNCLVCLPNFYAGPRQINWMKYTTNLYSRMYGEQEYGNAFVTRPDNAPEINNDEYWNAVRLLWRNRHVVLVAGNEKSLTSEMIGPLAASVRYVKTPEREAYAEIDAIEERIGTPSGIVLMCCGATATVLAARLARKKVHAVDIGHLGMFMKRMGVQA